MGDTPVIEDVDDPADVAANVRIDIEPDAAPASTATTATADDLASLEERMNLLLGAQQRETAMVNARLDALSQLDLASTLASAARDTAQREGRPDDAAAADKAIEELGGVQAYQEASVLTTARHRTCKWVFAVLTKLGMRPRKNHRPALSQYMLYLRSSSS